MKKRFCAALFLTLLLILLTACGGEMVPPPPEVPDPPAEETPEAPPEEPQEPEEPADPEEAALLALLEVNVFMYVIGSGFTRFYAHITRIPYEILAPIVMTFCIAGAYSTNNRVYDIYIILIFGIVAYFLRRMDFQLVPILLGIVLGPLAEKNFRRAMVISEGSFKIFFTRPISCAFILIAVGSVLLFAWKNYKARTVRAK